MNNQWRIENVRNADVIVNYARDRSTVGCSVAKEYTPDDTGLAVTLTGLTWAEMKLLMTDIGDLLDVDCPPAQRIPRRARLAFPSKTEPEAT